MRSRLVSAAVLVLAACNGAAPDHSEVSEEAAAIAENGPVIGTRSGEAVDYDEEGRRWFYKPSTRTALFGTEESEGVVSLSCNGSMTGEETLVFQWIETAPVDAKEALSISSGGKTASVELKGVASVRWGPTPSGKARSPSAARPMHCLPAPPSRSRCRSAKKA